MTTNNSIDTGTGTTGQVLQANTNAAPTYSTATYPSTTSINEILYSSANNTVSQIVSANNGTLITSAGGVPSISSTLPSAVQSNITAVGALASGSLTTGFTAVNVPQGGTGDTSFTAYAVLCGGTTSTGNLQSVASVGTAGQTLVSNGAAALPTFQSPVNIQTFTSTGAGTWTKPSVGTVAEIEVWGAGGGGARRSAGNGGGGGGGGYIRFFKPLSTLNGTENLSIGTGGAIQSTDNTAGNNGGNTSFGTSPYVTIYGGRGGAQAAVGNTVLGGGGGGSIDLWTLGFDNSTGAGITGASVGYSTISNTSVNPIDYLSCGGSGATSGNVVTTASTSRYSLFGGGGGGGHSTGSSTQGIGSTSVFGGNGAAGNSAGAGANGTSPGGGGGSGTTQGGSGGNGKIIVTVW